MKSLVTLCIGIVLAGMGAGCVTMNDPSMAASEKEDMAIMQEQLNRLQGRIETLDMEYKRLLGEIEKKNSASTSLQTQGSSIQSRLDTIERRLQEMDTAREKDRQEMIEQLSHKISDIMGTSTGRSSPAVKTATSKSNAAGQTGYEHIVQEGETISAIATAYHVKPGVIIEANSLKKPDALKKGQKLFIPQ